MLALKRSLWTEKDESKMNTEEYFFTSKKFNLIHAIPEFGYHAPQQYNSLG